MKVIFWGAGKTAYNIWQQMTEKPYLYTDDYLAFADNNAALWGKHFCGRQVVAPEMVHKDEFDIVVITSIYEDQIRKQLTEDLGILKEQIYSFGDYSRKCYADWIYRKRYAGSEEIQARGQFQVKRMVVYTAIIGNYDELRDPVFWSDGITYVCMTDNRNLKSDIWNMVYIKDSSMDNVHLARHIKMNPHIYFPDYEMSIWVDGKYQIMNDLRKYISLYWKGAGVLCFPHPERICICDEAAACIIGNRGNKEDIIIQTADYLRKGYPLNHGLFETGCMVRLHNSKKVRMLMGAWEKELLKYSIRDQISFPYVCWKDGFEPDICNLNINRNPWLLQKGHSINIV